VIEYNFSDADKIVDGGAYKEDNTGVNDYYTGADLNTAVGVTAGEFYVNDGLRNQGTIGDETGATGVGRAGISANGADAAGLQTMSFSLDIAAGADVDLTSINFTHGYYSVSTAAQGGTTDVTWYLTVTEGVNTYNYNSDGWKHDGGVNYQVNPDSPSVVGALALDSGLANLSDTTVDFVWTFSGQRGHNLDTQSNWIDDVSLTVIPEPATLGMVAVFGGGILFIRRRLML
jgi:hypothetical protein